jgi:hypothetical protein
MLDQYYEVIPWVPERVAAPLVAILVAVGDSDNRAFSKARMRLTAEIRADLER